MYPTDVPFVRLVYREVLRASQRLDRHSNALPNTLASLRTRKLARWQTRLLSCERSGHAESGRSSEDQWSSFVRESARKLLSCKLPDANVFETSLALLDDMNTSTHQLRCLASLGSGPQGTCDGRASATNSLVLFERRHSILGAIMDGREPPVAVADLCATFAALADRARKLAQGACSKESGSKWQAALLRSISHVLFVEEGFRVLTRWSEAGRRPKLSDADNRAECCLMGSALARGHGTNLVTAQIFGRIAFACDPALEPTLLPLSHVSGRGCAGACGGRCSGACALARGTCFVVHTPSHVVDVQNGGSVIGMRPEELQAALSRAYGGDEYVPTMHPSEMWQLTLSELSLARNGYHGSEDKDSDDEDGACSATARQDRERHWSEIIKELSESAAREQATGAVVVADGSSS
jgi:hypothetical protein